MGIARKSTADFISQGAILVITFIGGVIVSRVLLSEGRGIFQSVIFVNSLCVIFANLGIPIANTYLLGKDPRRLAAMHALSVFLIIIISIILFLFASLASEPLLRLFFKDTPRSYIVIAVAILPFSFYYMVWTQILIGLGEIITLAFFNIAYNIAYFLAIVLSLIVLNVGMPPEVRMVPLIYAWACIQILSVIAMYIILRKQGPVWSPLNFKLLWRTVSFGFVAYLSNVATALATRTDWLIVTGLLGAKGFGWYTLSGSWVEKIWRIAASIEKAAYAPVTGAPSQDEAARLVRRAFRNTFFLSVLLSLSLFIASYLFFILIYTEEFRQSLLPLWVLLIGTVFFNGARIFPIYFTGYKGKPQIPMVIAWAMFLINAPLCYVLVRNFGLWGAATSTSITYFIWFNVYLIWFIRDTGLKDIKEFFILDRQDINTYRDLIVKGWRLVLASFGSTR